MCCFSKIAKSAKSLHPTLQPPKQYFAISASFLQLGERSGATKCIFAHSSEINCENLLWKFAKMG